MWVLSIYEPGSCLHSSVLVCGVWGTGPVLGAIVVILGWGRLVPKQETRCLAPLVTWRVVGVYDSTVMGEMGESVKRSFFTKAKPLSIWI